MYLYQQMPIIRKFFFFGLISTQECSLSFKIFPHSWPWERRRKISVFQSCNSPMRWSFIFSRTGARSSFDRVFEPTRFLNMLNIPNPPDDLLQQDKLTSVFKLIRVLQERMLFYTRTILPDIPKDYFFNMLIYLNFIYILGSSIQSHEK